MKLTTEGLRSENFKSKILNSNTTICWSDVVGLEIKFAVYEKIEKTYICLSTFEKAIGIMAVNCSLVQFLDSANFFSRLNSYSVETAEMTTIGELINETKSLLDYIYLTMAMNQKTAEITLIQISETLSPSLDKISPSTLIELLDPLLRLTLPTTIILQYLADNLESLPANKELYKNILIAGIKKAGGLDDGTESNAFFTAFLKIKLKSPMELPDFEELFEGFFLFSFPSLYSFGPCTPTHFSKTGFKMRRLLIIIPKLVDPKNSSRQGCKITPPKDRLADG